jgi:hypothetical protein
LQGRLESYGCAALHERDGRNVGGLATLICFGDDILLLLVSLTLATTALSVSAKLEAGVVGATLGGAVGCASRKARLRAITSARMAITFEIDVSDIASPPLQCVVSEDGTVHWTPSRSHVRVRPSPSTIVSCDPLKVAVAVADILQALRRRRQRHRRPIAGAPQIDLQAIVLVIDEQWFPVGTAVGMPSHFPGRHGAVG